jgi:hypothetical protein
MNAMRTVLPTLIALFLAPASFAEDFKVSDLTFAKPEAWKAVEVKSAMRKAQFKVGDEGEVVFYHFGPGGAGGKKANIDRWFGQFKEERDAINPSTEDLKAGNLPVTLVSANGTFLSGMPGQAKVEKPGYALLGAIVEAKEGAIFVKFTGKKETVAAAKKDFRKMVLEAKE